MQEIDREGDKQRRTGEISGGGRGQVSAEEGIFGDLHWIDDFLVKQRVQERV